MPPPTINDVSDTALWVATYRALESERPDALFQDPLAKRLAGDKGRAIVKEMGGSSRYTSWSVVMRTVVIDEFLVRLAKEGVDTVLNCGAGLDTRPYRLDLPRDLRWIEVDYPHVIQLKEEQLKGEAPRCRLERIALDLADEAKRRRFFADVAAKAGRVCVLTEGVLPYLTEFQVAGFAQDLKAEPKFKHWIVDYFSPMIVDFMRRMRREQLKNAPFQFHPEDWEGFFRKNGWKVGEWRFLFDETVRVGRTPPAPWFVRFLLPFMSRKRKQAIRKNLAYVLLEPA